MVDPDVVELVLARCRASVPAWEALPNDAFTWDKPKGFSTFTMGVHANGAVSPQAVLYRSLSGKDNAILDFDQERAVYLALADARISAPCLRYDRDYRIEAFYDGRTLTRHDLTDSTVLRGIAEELYRFHTLEPPPIPDEPFFALLHKKWGLLARRVLTVECSRFPTAEQAMCDELLAMLDDRTLEMVHDFLPDSPLAFCHNDTYHGNVMKLETGAIKLLDFEFSCMNHPAFDFANLFAETVTRHGLADPPHFAIAEPEYTLDHIGSLVDAYLNCGSLTGSVRSREKKRLVLETLDMIPLSDLMYAMAAIPLAVDPVQKIRFIPYAHTRWMRFTEAHRTRTSGSQLPR